MKKRAAKPKSKPAAAKSSAGSKETPRRSAADSPHDPLHSLLRGTYAQRACEQRLR